MKRLFLSVFLIFSATVALSGQTTVFISRHADRFGTEPDPSLTPKGKAQAESLSRMLADANIRHIFTTELLRTRQTAEPLALKTGVKPVVVPQDRLDIFSQIDVDPGAGHRFMMDKWDGYVQARQRLVNHIAERKLDNVVILSGDNHNNWVLDVKRDPNVDQSPVVASEFVGTSLTSGGDGTDIAPEFASVLSKNPQVKFHNSQRGYVHCSITPRQMISDYRIVPYVTRPGAPVETRASFVVETGHPGATRAS